MGWCDRQSGGYDREIAAGFRKGARRKLARDAAFRAAASAIACFGLVAASAPAGAWEPTKSVEFIVPAGTGGGADQMARLI